MSIYIRVLLIIGAIALLGFMIRRIRQSKLKIEYTIFWIGFSVVLVLMGVFPQIVTMVARALGLSVGCEYGIPCYYICTDCETVL